MYFSRNLKKRSQSFVLDRLLHKILFNKTLNGLDMLRYQYFEYGYMGPDSCPQTNMG